MEEIDFIALDVETANPDYSSVCQIGIIAYANGLVVHQWTSLVNPQDYFYPPNVQVHGIDANMVQDSPTYPQVLPIVQSWLNRQIVVCHTPFDKIALKQVHEKYRLPLLQCQWLDTAKVTRRAWPQFSQSGYRIANVTEFLGIKFNHHDALEDARAAGEVLLHAVQETGIAVVDWLRRAEQPISQRSQYSVKATWDGNEDGPLFGEVLVFTGELSISRSQSANRAASAGCAVAANVTKKTTILVVGNQDMRKLVGHEKSSKHRRAEELIIDGQEIRIVSESDFLVLTESVQQHKTL